MGSDPGGEPLVQGKRTGQADPGDGSDGQGRFEQVRPALRRAFGLESFVGWPSGLGDGREGQAGRAGRSLGRSVVADPKVLHNRNQRLAALDPDSQAKPVVSVADRPGVPDGQPAVHDGRVDWLTQGEPGLGWIWIKAKGKVKDRELRMGGGASNRDDSLQGLPLRRLDDFGEARHVNLESLMDLPASRARGETQNA